MDATSGNGKPTERLRFNVPGSGSSFQFQLDITGAASTNYGGSASFETFAVTLNLLRAGHMLGHRTPMGTGITPSSQAE